MDPDASLYNLLMAASSGDHDSFNDHCDALTDWIAKGGFEPNWHATVKKASDLGCYGGNFTACLQKVRRYFYQCP